MVAHGNNHKERRVVSQHEEAPNNSPGASLDLTHKLWS